MGITMHHKVTPLCPSTLTSSFVVVGQSPEYQNICGLVANELGRATLPVRELSQRAPRADPRLPVQPVDQADLADPHACEPQSLQQFQIKQQLPASKGSVAEASFAPGARTTAGSSRDLANDEVPKPCPDLRLRQSVGRAVLGEASKWGVRANVPNDLETVPLGVVVVDGKLHLILPTKLRHSQPHALLPHGPAIIADPL
mmetsp:Transcript_68493/g.172607  ORF Transcript_68493/g.172607 Transcript_68493/m.172607 type:complete len:200 (+) Transcript_68493:755-1354(+)